MKVNEQQQIYQSTGTRVARNSIYSMTSQVVCRILGMIISIWLARYLGDAAFGRYIFIIAIIGFVQIATNFGMDQVLIRFVANNRNQASLFLGSGLLVRTVIFSLGFIPLIFLCILINKPMETKSGLFVGYFAVIFMMISQTLDNVFIGFEQLGIPSFLKILAKIVQLVLIVLMIRLRFGLVWIVGSLTVSELLRSIILCAIYSHKWGIPRLSKTIIVDMIGQSLPFIGITILSMIQTRSDVVLLGFWCKDEVLGWYGAAINITFAFLVFSSSVSDALYPAFSRLKNELKENLIGQIFYRSLSLLLVIGLPIALSIMILSHRIIELLYKESFKPAALVLAVTIWSIPVVFVNATIIRIINAYHYERYLLYIIAISACASVGMNILLIPRFQEVGPAISQIFHAVLSTILCILVMERKIIAMKYPFGTLLKVLPGLTGLGIFTWWAQNYPWIFLIPGGVIVYTLLILIFQALPMDDLRIILRIFRVFPRND